MNDDATAPPVTRAILFDFDGTLVEMKAGLWEHIEQVNREFDIGLDSREAFYKAFEGNFYEWLDRACGEPARAAAVKARLLDLVRTHYNPPFIPGMVDVVRALASSRTLAVLSSNATAIIRRVLEAAGVAGCFARIFSGEVEPSKATAIRHFLAGDGAPSRLEAAEVVLVTDTVGDVREALEAGVRAVGVAWGMHGEAKLRDAGAERVAGSPGQLLAWLGPAGA